MDMKHIVIGTAGHVDHGKTCLTKALTGVDTDRLKAAIDATGYTCLGIESAPYEKKGLFRR